MKKQTYNNQYLLQVRAEKALKQSLKDRSGSTKRPPYKRLPLDYLNKVKPNSTINETTEIVSLVVPKIFCLITNPEATLEFLASAANLVNFLNLKQLVLDHSEVEKHDLGAEVLLGFAIKEVEVAANYRNREIKISGKYPESDRKMRLINALGVVQKLEVEHRKSEDDKLEIFDFRGRKQVHLALGAEDDKNRGAKRFVDYLNRCLAYTKTELTQSGREDFLDYTGEIIDNAERHSDESKWYICGYLDDTDDGDSQQITDAKGANAAQQSESSDTAIEETEPQFCEIVIYNFGRSIADTFLELSDDSFAKSLVSPYIDHHTKKKLFTKTWRERDLLTLIALQSYISCQTKDADDDCGQGTVDLIEFFHRVSEETTDFESTHINMTIISGFTALYFDGKYRLTKNEKGREIIAFNDENDLNEKPDSNYVKSLTKAKFPGTLIAIRFPLSAKYIKPVEDESDNTPS